MTDKQSRLVLPALRGTMGDWAYYVTVLRLRDVADRVKLAEDIHESKTLNDLIQRQVTNRAGQIADYLLSQPQRFFNSLVIAVYGDSPQWYELDIRENAQLRASHLPEDTEGILGILALEGTEDLYALDGQHRVVGIKEAVKRRRKLGNDRVSAIFVSHRKDAPGMERTRRLFTTLNRYAKPVSALEKIAMDEDDIVAIVTRRLVNEYPVLKDAVSEAKGKNVSINDAKNITTLVALYDSLDKYLRNEPGKWEDYKKLRPNDAEIDEAYQRAKELWDALSEGFEPLRVIRDGRPAKEVVPQYRNRQGGHVLLRPIGLEMIIAVLRALRDQGMSLAEAVRRVASVPMDLMGEPWMGLLWDPRNQRINYRAENQRVATRLLFHGVGGELSYFKTTISQVRKELTGLLYPDDPNAPEVELPRYLKPP